MEPTEGLAGRTSRGLCLSSVCLWGQSLTGCGALVDKRVVIRGLKKREKEDKKFIFKKNLI